VTGTSNLEGLWWRRRRNSWTRLGSNPWHQLCWIQNRVRLKSHLYWH